MNSCHGRTVGDLSGEVVELGGGVSGFKPGDKVVSMSFPVSIFFRGKYLVHTTNIVETIVGLKNGCLIFVHVTMSMGEPGNPRVKYLLVMTWTNTPIF